MNQDNPQPTKVFDIRKISKLPHLKYFIDTNILKFTFARTIINEKNYQTHFYPEFIKKLRKEKCLCFTTTLNILELFSIIDKIDVELKNLKSIKNYRERNLDQYLAVREGIYEEVTSLINIFPSTIDLENIINYFSIDFSIDLHDYVYTKIIPNEELAVVTDDFEFVNISGINIFTANNKALELASK